nr:PREDICTED: cilia- and flagella-associated protein 157 isoform X2 [Bemisia tabaci]
MHGLDEDRADVIAFLKRTLQKKVDENAELMNRILALEQAREAEQSEFQQTITQKDKEFKEMFEQLNAEIKLLNGKLSSLEEFRIQKEDLMNKFSCQEKMFEDQEIRHKKELYDIERKFIVSKDQLKKDVEVKLLQLSLDFQNATQMRVAATTQRVIRENISMNNELAILIEAWNECMKKLEHLKRQEKELKLSLEIVTDESLKLTKCNKIKNKVIDDLTEKHQLLSEQNKEYQRLVKTTESLKHEKESVENEKRFVEKEKYNIEEQLKMLKMENNQQKSEFLRIISRNYLLEDTISQAVRAVKEAFMIQQEPTKDQALNVHKRGTLLRTLLDIFEVVEVPQDRALSTYRTKEQPPLQPIKSEVPPYSLGDLGLIPKSIP